MTFFTSKTFCTFVNCGEHKVFQCSTIVDCITWLHQTMRISPIKYNIYVLIWQMYACFQGSPPPLGLFTKFEYSQPCDSYVLKHFIDLHINSCHSFRSYTHLKIFISYIRLPTRTQRWRILSLSRLPARAWLWPYEAVIYCLKCALSRFSYRTWTDATGVILGSFLENLCFFKGKRHKVWNFGVLEQNPCFDR